MKPSITMLSAIGFLSIFLLTGCDDDQDLDNEPSGPCMLELHTNSSSTNNRILYDIKNREWESTCGHNDDNTPICDPTKHWGMVRDRAQRGDVEAQCIISSYELEGWWYY